MNSTVDAPDLSILIVTYRNPEMTAACLSSVFEQTRDLSFEVLVHDNASDDSTPQVIAERFPEVDLSQGEGNLGFARANNRLAERARGHWLVLLNPDTVVLDGALQRLVAAGEDAPSAVPLGGRTLRPDDSLDPSSCWGAPSRWSLFCFGAGLTTAFPKSRYLDPESLGRWERDTWREVGIVTGCLALVPSAVWRQLGGFDETFWMYGEDADLSMRARRLGYRPAITPRATITHHVGASSAATGPKTVLVLRAKVTLLTKHWSSTARWFGISMLLLGVGLRAGLELVLRRRDPAAPWTHAWRRRRAWMRGFEDS